MESYVLLQFECFYEQQIIIKKQVALFDPIPNKRSTTGSC